MARSCSFSGGQDWEVGQCPLPEAKMPVQRFCPVSKTCWKVRWRQQASTSMAKQVEYPFALCGSWSWSYEIGQMPELIGGLNDWIMYQCWESNSRPISPCLDAQIGSHTSHTSSPVISCVLSSCCPCRWRTLDAFGSCQLQGGKVRFMELCCPQALERETQGNGTLCYESTC